MTPRAHKIATAAVATAVALLGSAATALLLDTENTSPAVPPAASQPQHQQQHGQPQPTTQARRQHRPASTAPRTVIVAFQPSPATGSRPVTTPAPVHTTPGGPPTAPPVPVPTPTPAPAPSSTPDPILSVAPVCIGILVVDTCLPAIGVGP